MAVASFAGREQLRQKGLSRLPKGSAGTSYGPRYLCRQLNTVSVWLLSGRFARFPAAGSDSTVSKQPVSRVGVLGEADLIRSMIMERVGTKQMLM